MVSQRNVNAQKKINKNNGMYNLNVENKKIEWHVKFGNWLGFTQVESVKISLLIFLAEILFYTVWSLWALWAKV